MKMILKAELMAKHEDCGQFGVKLVGESVKENLIPAFYLAMLKAMRDGHTRDFYKALVIFCEEDTDKMHEFFEGGGDND